MIDDIWEAGGSLLYAALIVFVVAAVYTLVVPLIDPSGPFSGIIENVGLMGTAALGLLVGGLLFAASIVIDQLNSFGTR